MSKFKVGDKVRVVANYNEETGENRGIALSTNIYEILRYDGETSNQSWETYTINDSYNLTYYDVDLELINNKNNMNLIETFRRVGLKEPEKSLIDLGFMNNSEELTGDGQTLFLTWLLQEHKDKFFTDVVKPIKEYEDAKKNSK